MLGSSMVDFGRWSMVDSQWSAVESLSQMTIDHGLFTTDDRLALIVRDARKPIDRPVVGGASSVVTAALSAQAEEAAPGLDATCLPARSMDLTAV
jgi:hypothetical protein